jgi:thymidylate synthase
VEEQLKREPLPLPEISLNPAIRNIDDFTMDDISLQSYQHHPAIKAPMAV